MLTIVVKDYRELSEKAAAVVAGALKGNPALVLGLATGSTPESMYARLVDLYRQNTVSFARVRTFNLDEYAYIPAGNPQSYTYYMKKNFFDHVDINPAYTHLPACGRKEDVKKTCSAYESEIESAGGIDLQVLGLGVNGHIGFNEPGPHLQVKTHLVTLAEETVEANSRFFDSPGQVPRQAITMGMGTIMQAKKILLLASGRAKAGAVEKALNGRVTTALPASFLQLHRDATVLIDEEAANLL